jgi:hypothetical protein
MNLSIFIIPLAVSIGIVIVLTAFPKRSVAGATSLIIFALALVIWAVSYALFKISTPGLGFFWLSFVNLGATVASRVHQSRSLVDQAQYLYVVRCIDLGAGSIMGKSVARVGIHRGKQAGDQPGNLSWALDSGIIF